MGRRISGNWAGLSTGAVNIVTMTNSRRDLYGDWVSSIAQIIGNRRSDIARNLRTGFERFAVAARIGKMPQLEEDEVEDVFPSALEKRFRS